MQGDYYNINRCTVNIIQCLIFKTYKPKFVLNYLFTGRYTIIIYVMYIIIVYTYLFFFFWRWMVKYRNIEIGWLELTKKRQQARLRPNICLQFKFRWDSSPHHLPLVHHFYIIYYKNLWG